MPARSSILTLFVGVSFAACAGGSTGPRENEDNSRLDSDPPIQTDQLVYTAERGTTYYEDGRVWGRYVRLDIALRYTNPTGGPIYLPTCHSIHPPALEKKQGGAWSTAYSPIVQACAGPPEIIEPGKTFEYSYQVEGYLSGGNVWPQFETSVAGTYRLVWTAYATWTVDSGETGLGRELPLADRVSNEFEVVE
jgi:hypothetical protein